MDLRKLLTSLLLVVSLGIIAVIRPFDVRAIVNGGLLSSNEQVEEDTTEVVEEEKIEDTTKEEEKIEVVEEEKTEDTTEVVDNEESQDTSENVANVEDNNKEKNTTAKDFKLDYWEYDDTTNPDEIVLQKYKWSSGVPYDMYIPGEYNGKRVYIENLKKMFEKNYYVYSVEMEAVNGTKVGLKDKNVAEAFRWPRDKLKKINVEGLDITGVTDMSYMFNDTPYAKEIIGIENWDVSHVEKMNYMFQKCGAENLDLSKWETNSLTEMLGMFASSWVRTLNVSNWDTSKVTAMGESIIDNTNYYMTASGVFSTATYLKKIIGLETWDVSNVKTMSFMFYRTEWLESLDLSNWKTDSLTEMVAMFHTSGISYLNVTNWNTSGITYMNKAASDKSKPYAKDFSLFNNCKNLSEIVGLETWDVSNITNMNYMFYQTPKLERLDLSSWKTDSLTEMFGMFAASGITYLNVSGWNTSKVTSMGVESSYGIFDYSQKLSEIVGVEGWDVSNVTDMSRMFAYTGSDYSVRLKGLDLSDWKTDSLTKMDSMFQGSGITELIFHKGNGTLNDTSDDTTSWNLSKVTSLNSVFYNTTNLKELDLYTWDVSNITNMDYLFYNSGISYINVIDWDVSKVTTMKEIFRKLRNLPFIDLTGWDVSGPRIMDGYTFGEGTISTMVYRSLVIIAQDPDILKVSLASYTTPKAGPTFHGQGGVFDGVRGNYTKTVQIEKHMFEKEWDDDQIDAALDNFMATVSLPSKSTYENAIFDRWSKVSPTHCKLGDSDPSDTIRLCNMADKLNIQIDANWRDGVITFLNRNDEFQKYEGVKYDSIIPDPGIPEKPGDGYVFEGWYAERDGNLFWQKYIPGYHKMPSRDLVLRANWVPASVVKYPKEIRMLDQVGNTLLGKGNVVLDNSHLDPSQGTIGPYSEFKIYVEDGDDGNATPNTITMTGDNDTFEATIHNGNSSSVIKDKLLGTLYNRDGYRNLELSLKYANKDHVKTFKDGVKFTGKLKFTLDIIVK